MLWCKLMQIIIIGQIPSTLYQLTKLQQLLLNGNNLIGIVQILVYIYLLLMYWICLGPISTSLCRLTGLTFLDLSNTEITSLPSNVGCLTLLQELHLSGTFISSIASSIVSLSAVLHVLDVSFTYINGSIPTLLCKLSTLKGLNLGRNSMSGTMPTCIGKLIDLTSLSISENSLEGSIPSQIGLLTYLQEFDAHGCQFSGIMIKYLDYGINKMIFVGQIPSAFYQMTKLQSLSMGNNYLSGILCGLCCQIV